MTLPEPSDVLQALMAKAKELGLEPETQGSIIADERLVFKALGRLLEHEGVIYADMKEALRDYPDIVYRYGFKKFSIDDRTIDTGVLLYVPRKVKLDVPVYTCFALSRKGVMQRVYNLIVIEDDASAVGVTGCLALVPEGAHVSLEEVYVGKRAEYTKAMVHNWLLGNVVSAVKKVSLEEGAVVYDYYINNSPLKTIKLKTEVEHVGPSSVSRVDEVVVGRRGGSYEYDIAISLFGPDSSTEVVSRVIATESASVRSNILVEAVGERSKGHVECKGLMLDDGSQLVTTPSLASRTPHAMLTHEASVGKIRKEELEYLMSKGFTEEEAIALIVRGFLETGVDKLPQRLRGFVSSVLDITARALF